MQHSSRRHGYLLNDVLLITSVSTNRTSVFSSAERIQIRQVIYLDQMSLLDLKKVSSEEDPCAFEIITADRSYVLIAESESDKAVWLEEIEMAAFALRVAKEQTKLGWFHDLIRGSFHSAALLGDVELVKKYVNDHVGEDLDIEDESGMTPLHWAVLAGHLEIVKLLVHNGADVDTLNKGLNSSILLAAAFAREDIVIFLLDSGADVLSLRNMKDYDCLMMAVIFGIETAQIHEIVFALKTRGVTLNRFDISGATPLHECSARNLALSIQTLVSAGADVNAKHGRSGLTPLQLACSNAEPNAETVRSLLDKGACPNWKDTNKRTAFDLVLHSREVKGQSGDTSNPVGLRQTVDEVQEFVLERLPALLEIVKKGGRYSPEGIAILRPSFQDMINETQKAWRDAAEPENFLDYVKSQRDEAFLPKSWTADSASAACLLCLDKFSMSNRRHHCRSCGVLCCDACSSKRLRLRPSGTSPSNASKKFEPERACDSCFNRLVFEYHQWCLTLARLRREQQRYEQRMVEGRAMQRTGSVETAGGIGSSNSSVRRNTSSQQLFNNNGDLSPVSMTAQPMQAMSDAMRNLEERGERLQQVAERSEEMRVAASEFRSMTRQLLNQQQSRAGMR
jgi:ankyrin repeat protein